MAVSTQPPINEYTANGSVTVFAYTYYVIEETDLKVYFDGVVQSTSLYTVSGVGNSGGGDVTFISAPTNSVIVRLQREIPNNRTTDYINAGALNSDTMDADFDRIVMQVQDLDSVSLKENASNEWDAESQKIVNLATPTANTDAVTKLYSDTNVTLAAASAAAALVSETNAATSETNAAATYDSFDDRYLGSKTTSPTLDNDSNTLLTGALYWNSTSDEMRVYTGSGWVVSYNASTGISDNAIGTLLTLDANYNIIMGPMGRATGSELVFHLSNADVFPAANPVNGIALYSASGLLRLRQTNGVLLFPDAVDTLIAKNTTDILTNKTLTSAVLNVGISGTAILDEDTLVSDSATQLATQQSIKAYVDDSTSAIETLTILDTPVQLVASMTEDAWTTVDNSTLNTANATKTILRILAETSAGTQLPGTIDAFIRKTGSALANNDLTQVMSVSDYDRYSGAELTQPNGCVEFIVNLDTNYDFDYYITSNLVLAKKKVILVGYWS